MQPIHYSLILNLAGIVASTILALAFSQPLLLLVTILLATHALSRFAPDAPPAPPERERGIGFMADLGTDPDDEE
jgi:hypothetical protein